MAITNQVMKMKIWFLNLALFAAFALNAQSKMASFNAVEIDGPVIVKLIAGDDTGVVAIKEKDLVSWEVNGESLVVMAQYEKNRDAPQIEITVSDLKALSVTGSVILEGKGEFATRRMEIKLSGQSIASLDVDTEILYARINSQSILTLSGNADDFNLDLNSQSIANAEDLQAATINVSANNQSVATVNSNGAKVNSQANNQSIVVQE